MTNDSKYTSAFVSAFDVTADTVDSLAYQSIAEWDSVGHMALIAEIEGLFGVQLEMDDVIEFNSFAKGKEILRKYKIEI
jgi:acyl carrier protein